MQLESLKIFCDVVRLASFSRAAKENDVSQSSASQVVLQLEQRLGARLLDRSKRPLVTTDAGRAYYEGCRGILAEYQELENRVRLRADETPVEGILKVSSIYSVGLHYMVKVVSEFRDKHPQAQIRIEYQHPSSVLDHVLNDTSELGLISFPKKWPELNVIPWREERMVLAVPPGHRLAGREFVEPADLQDERFVVFDDGLPIRRAIDRYLRHHSVSVDVSLAFDNIETIKRAVEIGSGVAILPEPTLANECSSGSLFGISLKSDHDSLTRPLAIIHRKHRVMSPVAQRFLKRLTEDSAAESTSRVPAALTGGQPPGPNQVSNLSPASSSTNRGFSM